MFVDYDESILAYVASIRSYFGLESSYKSNEGFSAYLKEIAPAKIFVVLIDGMGSRLIKRKLPEDSFLRRNCFGETMTVFPPTTAAATTAIRNGKSPDENGWLGWTSYIPEVDDVVVLLLDESYYSDKKYHKGYVRGLIPVSDTTGELQRLDIPASNIFPYYIEEGGYDGLEDFAKKIIEASYSENRYVYAYYDKYDSLMHKNGVDDTKSDALLMEIDKILEDLSTKIAQDTLLIITADHGLVDVKRTINIVNTDLYEYLERPCTLEDRATVFYIKEGKEIAFAKKFKNEYGDDFILLSKEEVKESRLFGIREAHERFDDFIGDFIAIAKGSSNIICKRKEDFVPKASHSGCTNDELYVPLITYIR